MDSVAIIPTDRFESDFQHFVKHRLGRGAFISNKHQLSEKQWNYTIGTYIPQIIADEGRQKTLKFLRFDSVGSVSVQQERNSMRVSVPNHEKLGERVEQKIAGLIMEVQNAILKVTHRNLVHVPAIQTHLAPLKEILIYTHQEGQVPTVEYVKSRGARAIRYFKFLEDLGFLRKSKQGNSYESGNLLIQFEKEFTERPSWEIYDKILSLIIEQGYPYLQDYLNLTAITPYLRWETCYFFPASIVKKNIGLSFEHLEENHYRYFKIKKSHIEARKQINYLVAADVLDRDDDRVVADPSIFDAFLRMYEARIST